MKRVLLSHAGGRLGLGFTRALKAAPEPLHLIGLDAGEFSLQRAETDEKNLTPRANEEDYIPVLKSIIAETRPDFLWVQHEAEIDVVSQNAHSLGIPTFLPPPETIALCQDKLASYQRLYQAKVPVPDSILLHNEADLHQAFRELGREIWLRAISGTGGRGSLPVADYDFAKRWVDFHQGWGRFMAARRLTQKMVTWESIWREGKLIFAQGRMRLYWEFGNLTLSGVTGVGGAHRWVADPVVDDIAMRAIKAINPNPHGVFSVDMTYDWQDLPNVTEINVGRFMSGGVVHFFEYGLNVPYLTMQVGLGTEQDMGLPMLNPLAQNVVLIHGVDILPVVVDVRELEGCTEALEKRRATLRAPTIG